MARASQRARFESAYRALTTIAVTGTNGKTSATSMVDAIVRASGQPSARLTTLGGFVNGAALALPERTQEFLFTVEAAIAAGVKTLALEVTSKALRTGWARDWPAHVAVFTNLSRDHMDMHGSPEEYLACKAQLFMSTAPAGCCVLNADDPSAALIAEVIAPGTEILYYSATPEAAVGDKGVEHALAIRDLQSSRTGLRIELAESTLADALGRQLELRVVGKVHASNALAAALACSCAGYAPEAIREGLKNYSSVPGRFEVVADSPLCVVDYAHTPEGLRGTLETARQLLAGQGCVSLVFGCGGERDQGKRPAMGQVAHQLADQVILTNDNPRREDPARIAAQVQAGVHGAGADWQVCLDRQEAVERAVCSAHEDDIVIIAGKGHEVTQELADSVVAMADAQLVRRALDKREGRA